MLTKNFHQLQAEVQRHVEAALVKQGSCKTGVIGNLARGICLAGKKNSPEYIEREYGIPRMVSLLAESIFGGLPRSEAASFFAALPSAIECDGKDLSRVGWQFLAAESRALPAVSAEAQAVVAPVIKGMDLLAEGKEWPARQAESASKASAAYVYAYAGCAASTYDWAVADAAYAAAYAYTDAAYDASTYDWAAAAYSATDPIPARRRQRDTLLKLIKEAPITLEENS
jgi:hypothetical protein